MDDVVDRRNFLRTSAALSAGLILSPSALAQSENEEAKPVNVALIGAGRHGRVLIDACSKMGLARGGKDANIRFKAVCDIWEVLNLKLVSDLLKRLGHDVNSYVDYQEMLESEKDLDAVIIATPDFCHAEQAVACLKASLHVYCEAPMSNTIEGARQMVQAARQTGKLLQIGHQRRSNPRYIHCQGNLLQSAAILGQITAVNGQSNHPARPDIGWSKRKELDQATLEKYGYESMHQFKNWMWYKKLSAGPVSGFGVHQVDVFNWFLNAPPTSVTANGGIYYYDKKNHQRYDTVMSIFEYEMGKGKLAAFYQTITTNGYGGNYEAFMGEHGTLEICESGSRGGIYRDPDAPDWDTWVRLGFLNKPGQEEQSEQQDEGVIVVEQTKPPTLYEIPVKLTDPYHMPHLQNFFETVHGNAQLNCPAEVAYKATAAVLKINDAIEAGKRLSFKPEEFTI